MKIKQITINEKAKVAKASDKKPKVSKPNLGHESPHPMQGKLVGEEIEVSEEKRYAVSGPKGPITHYASREEADEVIEMLIRSGLGEESDFSIEEKDYPDKVATPSPMSDSIEERNEKFFNFDGKYIDDDLKELFKIADAKNFLAFLSWAMADDQFSKLPLSRFGDNIKRAYNQWNANQQFQQHDKDQETFKKLDTPIAQREPSSN